jgi:NADP-dependent 3-hydroxy acid dehydrogenase YdfG
VSIAFVTGASRGIGKATALAGTTIGGQPFCLERGLYPDWRAGRAAS